MEEEDESDEDKDDDIEEDEGTMCCYKIFHPTS